MNNRDLKIAKRLHNCINQYFHVHEKLKAYIEKVEMTDRKNAHIYYANHHQETMLSIKDIQKHHDEIIVQLPHIKKHIAKELNLKAIPNLHFCPYFDTNDH